MSVISRTINEVTQNYDFKYNEVTSKIYVKNKGEKNYKEVDDMALNSIYVKCKQQVKGVNFTDFTSVLKSDVCKRYNPFDEYFNNLPQWDGKTDYIKQLSNTINVSSRRKMYWQKFFKKWLIGVVACAIDEPYVNHLIIIFIGKQGVGKTTWLNKLLPKELKEHLFMGTIKDNKDSEVHLSECMFINIDEFETIGRKGLNQLKSKISQQYIRIRRPYGRIQESLVRRASFMASVNDHKILTDSTGNRRFLVFEVNDIDFKHNVDMRMVYSQCLHLYRNGFQPYLTPKEVEKVNRINEGYVIKSFEEELLMKYFKQTIKKEGEVLTTTEIWQRINEQSKTHMNNTSTIVLGKALSKNNFVKGRLMKNKAHGWWVIDKSKTPKKSKGDFNS